MEALVLAITRENADALLDGRRRSEHRRFPPKRLPARAYLAVSGEGIVGECELGAPGRRTDDGWALPISRPRRYRAARALDAFGLTRTPRSFRYVRASEGVARARPRVSSRASTRSSRG